MAETALLTDSWCFLWGDVLKQRLWGVLIKRERSWCGRSQLVAAGSKAKTVSVIHLFKRPCSLASLQPITSEEREFWQLVTFGGSWCVDKRSTQVRDRQMSSRREGWRGRWNTSFVLYLLVPCFLSFVVWPSVGLVQEEDAVPHPPLGGRLCLLAFEDKAFLFLTPFYVVRGVVRDGKGIWFLIKSIRFTECPLPKAQKHRSVTWYTWGFPPEKALKLAFSEARATEKAPK